METKKTWEYVSSALISIIRPSHCPFMKISNVKPAHASDDISIHHGADSLEFGFTNLRIYGSTDSVLRIYTQREHTHCWEVHLIIYIKGILAVGRYKINPRERFLLHYRCMKNQSCEV